MSDNDWVRENEKRELEDKIRAWWMKSLDEPPNSHELFFAKWGTTLLLACGIIFICSVLVGLSITFLMVLL